MRLLKCRPNNVRLGCDGAFNFAHRPVVDSQCQNAILAVGERLRATNVGFARSGQHAGAMRTSNLQLVFSRPLTAAMVFVAAASSSALAEKTTREIYDQSKNAVVLLISYDLNGAPASQGSGFYFETNRIASNFHVVKGASSVRFRVIGSKQWHAAKKIASVSTDLDLAVLEVDQTGPPLKISSVESVGVGDKIVAIGNPEGLEGSVSEGIVSGVRGTGRFRILQITAPISHGSSGGPLFTAAGEVVGVTTSSLMDSQNLNFAVPASLLLTLSGQGRAWEPVLSRATVPERKGSGGSFSTAETKGRFTLGQQMERMITVLTLTDEQKPKVKAVLEESSKKRQEIMSDTSLDRASIREKMQPIMEEQNKKMKAILTDDQYTKYQEMNQRGKKGGKKAEKKSE